MPAAEHSPTEADGPGPFAHRPFTLYWLARLAANLAIQMQVVAVGWQMYELTGSALDLGLVGLVQFAPALALIFVTGPVIDRFDRRWILVGFRVVEGLASASLALATFNGWLTPGFVYAFVFVIGVARAFEMPAGSAILPSLIPEKLLSRAVALSSTAHQGATIVGPALGGLLFVAGPQSVYVCCTALFGLAALLMLGVRDTRRHVAQQRISIAYLVAGFTFIRRHPLVLGAVSLDLFAVLLGGATALLPIYARDILHTGPWGLGLLRTAPAVGALAMALWLAKRTFQRNVGRTLLLSVGGFGIATIVFGVSTWLPLSLLALVALGATDMVSVVIRMSLVQLETPDEMRGRVGAVNSVFIGGSNQIGEFESGVTAAWFGTVPAVVIGGIGTLLVVAAWFKLFPELARRQRIDQRTPGHGP